MPTEWPGYTPPATGSSRNCGTPPLSSYTNREAAIKSAWSADGADTTQEPPQHYENWTVQKRNEPEAHGVPTAPGKPTVTASGTAGKATVAWSASYSVPSGGYVVQASSGQQKMVKGDVLTTDISGLTVSSSVTFTVTALGLLGSATSPASNSYTVV